MKRNNILIVTSILGALLLLAQPGPSQQPPAATSRAAAGRGGGFARGGEPFNYSDNAGWVSLFDGDTLNGWSGDTRYWGIKDGAIYVEPTCEKPTGTIYLVWQGGDLANFMLKFESKGTASVNGGVQFRSYMTADNNVDIKYPGRGGGGFLATAGRGPGMFGGRSGRGGGRGPGAGRGPQCANPGTPPSAEERAKFDMAGPQFDFDANNRYSGQYYEQASSRGIAAPPGSIVLAEPGKRIVMSTIADKATLDSWFKKDDYNQFLLIANGNVSSMFMNGHLISVFIDDDPAYFRRSGKLGLEVEGLGAYYTRNIFLKRM